MLKNSREVKTDPVHGSTPRSLAPPVARLREDVGEGQKTSQTGLAIQLLAMHQETSSLCYLRRHHRTVLQEAGRATCCSCSLGARCKMLGASV